MSDLIDRQAVRLAKVPYDEQLSEYERGWNDACEAIADNVPAAPRWVRCEDDKPKKNGRYIVFDNENGVYSAEFRKGRLRSEWTDEEEGWCNFRVTHWMPLPEPPKEVQDADK